MKHALRIGRSLARLGVFIILAAGNLFAQPATSSAPAIDKDFVKTNGAFVTFGSVTVKTNHPWNTDEYKEFRWRVEQLHRTMNSRGSNATEQFVSGAWALIKDFPARPNGYQCLMGAIEMYESGKESPKARALADEMIASSAPEKYKRWARGFLNRLDSQGKPVSLRFTAVDGRKVDLSQMRGKVVLVDFWGTRCGPCVGELPRVKAAFDKFHSQGFEVIGISCDTDQRELEKYVKRHDICWPQYFDGKQQNDNRFTVEFGINGIPHMFLVDKRGLLRFDNVRASDQVHTNDDSTSLEGRISTLLAEPSLTE